MKIFHYDRGAAREIGAFNSKNLAMTRILRSDRELHIGCMFVGPDGIVGHHQATTEQLFLVIEGEGWVKGGDGREVFISAGSAAFWTEGEWHETRSDNGMTAIVIEGPDLKHHLPEEVS